VGVPDVKVASVQSHDPAAAKDRPNLTRIFVDRYRRKDVIIPMQHLNSLACLRVEAVKASLFVYEPPGAERISHDVEYPTRGDAVVFQEVVGIAVKVAFLGTVYAYPKVCGHPDAAVRVLK